MCKSKIRKIITTAVVVGILTLMGVTVISGASDKKEETVRNYGSTDTTQYEVQTNRHTQYVEPQKAENLLSTEGFEEKANNGIISLWYHEDTEALRIVDLRSGYIWGCIDDKEEYGLNKKWANRASSMLYITYFNLKGKEESCALSENTFKPTYNWNKDGFTCKVSAKKLGISFAFSVKIEDDKLIFEMKDKSIKETGKSKLAQISFMSFMGSVYEDTIPGYIMVPDGSGALIRFQKTKAYQSGYSRKVYGRDMAIDKDTVASNLNGNRTDDYATEEKQLYLPLWGMVHGENQNGYLATIDSGELHAVINAIPAGAVNQTVRFTRAYTDFVYRSEYNKRVSNSKVIAVPQEKLNEMNPILTFTFLAGEEANYSGMAKVYREKLLKEGVLTASNSKTEGDIPMLVHTVGSEVKTGFLSNGLETLTTAEQAENILETLQKKGINKVSMILSGWNKGGYHGASYGDFRFEKRVGSKEELQQLQNRLEKQGGNFALVLNPVTANEDQININQDTALDATLDTMLETIPNKSLMYPTTYYIRHSLMKKTLEKSFEELRGFDLMLENIGKYLCSDYTVRDEVTRGEADKEIVTTLGKASQGLLLDGANFHLLKYAKALMDIPVSNSQYIYETDSVPFLQMVLRGSKEYYAPYANQGFYSNASMLKMIEYGAYPSFIVTGADNFSLNETPLENYFSLNYVDWEEKMEEVYEQVNGALKYVQGASMTLHNTEAEGVYCVSYDNGIKLYVNYNNEDFVTENGMSVPAGSYAVEE